MGKAKKILFPILLIIALFNIVILQDVTFAFDTDRSQDDLTSEQSGSNTTTDVENTSQGDWLLLAGGGLVLVLVGIIVWTIRQKRLSKKTKNR